MKPFSIIASILLLLVNLCILIHFWNAPRDAKGNVIHREVATNVIDAKNPSLFTLEIICELNYTGVPITTQFNNTIRDRAYLVRNLPLWDYYIIYSREAVYQAQLPVGATVQAWCLPLSIESARASLPELAAVKNLPEGKYTFLLIVDTVNITKPTVEAVAAK